MANLNIILSLALIACCVRRVHGNEVEISGGDDNEATSKRSLAGTDRKKIIDDYFKEQGFRIDLDDESYEHYDSDVVSRMKEFLNVDNKSFLGNYRLTCEINSMIHARLAKQENSDESVLETLYRIVPRSESQPTLDLAKRDLRNFLNQQPDHCRELLRIIGAELDASTFHTQDAIKFLEASLHNWTPLGRLNKYIEEFGESSK